MRSFKEIDWGMAIPISIAGIAIVFFFWRQLLTVLYVLLYVVTLFVCLIEGSIG